MSKIVECVPNFSEGKNQINIDKIVSPFKNKEGFKLVNVESDPDYNRTVVTLIGDPDKIIEALIPFTEIVVNLIDMNYQKGEHSRMGAIDVIPFIPIENVTMKDCVSYAEIAAEKISSMFQIPIFLYAEAARKEDRVLLPNIRKGEFEGMKEKIQESNWTPDFGEAKIHPTFGCIAIGAREFLVAYNIDIPTLDEKVAKEISKSIRTSSGGFGYIQAGPVTLEQRGHTQVTMNILNYKKNPIYRIFELVSLEALRYHLEIKSAEIIGLIPKKALIQSIQYYLECENIEVSKSYTLEELVDLSRKYLKLRDFSVEKIIESHL